MTFSNPEHLIECIDALLDLDTRGALVPEHFTKTGIPLPSVCGHAKTMLLATVDFMRSLQSALAAAEDRIAELEGRVEYAEAYKQSADEGMDRMFAEEKEYLTRIAQLQSASDQQAAEIAKLRKALEPFAKEAKYYDPDQQDGRIIDDDFAFSNDGDDLNVGDLRRARAALGDMAEKLEY